MISSTSVSALVERELCYYLSWKYVFYLQGTPERSPPFAPLDPLSTPLPKAPRMRVYCGYGHGLPTERAYHYKHDKCDDDQRTNVNGALLVMISAMALESWMSLIFFCDIQAWILSVFPAP